MHAMFEFGFVVMKRRLILGIVFLGGSLNLCLPGNWKNKGVYKKCTKKINKTTSFAVQCSDKRQRYFCKEKLTNEKQ